MRAVFLSYRRDDAEGEAGRLFDDLIAEFSRDKVFMDVTGIEPGRDFRKVIDQNVTSCGVLLAIIGKDWIDAEDNAGRRRLDDPMDFVRLETASALRRDIPVIPVLVHGGRMPRPEQLPEDLKDLAYRNAVELTHARWDSDVQLLIKALRPHVDIDPDEVGDAKAQPALDRSAGQSVTSDSKVTELGRTTSAPLTQPTKKFWRGNVVAGVVAIVIVAGGVGLYEYKKTEEAKVKKAPTEAATTQAAEDQRVATEREAARKAAEEKAAAEGASRKAAQDRAAAEQAARRAAEDRNAAEQAAARKVADEKAAAERAARKSWTGQFDGIVHNNTAGVSASFGIVVNEIQGTISGCMVVQQPLFGTGPLTGRIEGANVSFVVPNAFGTIIFVGHRRDLEISGTYTVKSPGRFDQQGNFTLHQHSTEGMPAGFNTTTCPTDAEIHK